MFIESRWHKKNSNGTTTIAMMKTKYKWIVWCSDNNYYEKCQNPKADFVKKKKIKYVSVNTRNIPKFLLKCGALVIIVVFKRNP